MAVIQVQESVEGDLHSWNVNGDEEQPQAIMHTKLREMSSKEASFL